MNCPFQLFHIVARWRARVVVIRPTVPSGATRRPNDFARGARRVAKIIIKTKKALGRGASHAGSCGGTVDIAAFFAGTVCS